MVDLETDPPPDIVVEIDTTNESVREFSIYAALQVPEIWQYDGSSIRFLTLSAGSYVDTAASNSIPILKPELVASALDWNKRIGQTAALRAFRHDLQRLLADRRHSKPRLMPAPPFLLPGSENRQPMAIRIGERTRPGVARNLPRLIDESAAPVL